MHFFMHNLRQNKPSQQVVTKHENEPETQQHNQQHNQQVQQKIIKKIVVRKKPKLQLSELNDHIIQTQSDHLVSEHKTSKSAEQLKPLQRDKQQGPFISFMGSEEEDQQMNTPYLTAETPTSYHLNKQAQKLYSSSSQQRNLGRTMSRPIEPVSLETPSSKNLTNNQEFFRQNSIRTEFQPEGQQRQLTKYPTEISLQHEEINKNYGNSRELSKFAMLKNKQIEISILESKHSEQLNSSGFTNEIPTSKSPKLIFRPQFFRANTGNSNQMNLVEEMQDNDSNSEVSGNQQNAANTLALSNRLTEVLNSSRSVSRQNTDRSNVQQTHTLTYDRTASAGYKSYIEKQNRQLQQQRQRMYNYAEEANKLLCKVDTYETSQTPYEVMVDKHFMPLKYMIEELIDLFAIGEVIKYQLRYRSYEILTKIYAEASDYYGERIQLQEPIKAYTFSLALKAILSEYQKSELDTVVTKIFQASHVISYDDFLLQFGSVLNSRLVAVLEPESMKKVVDKTLDKIKSLFVIWIETEYYNKKVKEILRSNKAVFETIMAECSSIEEPQKFEMELLEKFFLEGERKNPMKKNKLDLYFRNLLGNDLLKAKWMEWIEKDEMRLYNRYESKLMYERRQFNMRSDQAEKQREREMKAEKTIQVANKKMKINLEENYLSRRTQQSRKMIEF